MNTKKGSARSTKHTLSLLFATLIGSAGVFALAYFELPSLLSVTYSDPAVASTTASTASAKPEVPAVVHLPTPVPLKAIYMTQCVVGTPSFRDSLVRFIEDTELNAVVIDIKDFSGGIAFPSDNPAFAWAVSKKCGAGDMAAFVKSLHEKDIYVIGRITVFQDPLYTARHPKQAVQKAGDGSSTELGTSVWKDYKGLSFVDVGARDFWDYIVELSKESYAIGFDELNYDYIRYPSDGPMSEAVYSLSDGNTKPEMLELFFQYMTPQVRATGAVLSADLFGMTATNEDDLNIGQVLERALPYFDFVDPMVYPSHYPKNFHGYANPNEHPYDIVRFAMDSAVARATATTTTVAALAHSPIMRAEVVPAHDGIATTTRQVAVGVYEKQAYPTSKIRPWLQSFDYPVTYTKEMVAAQIQATLDAGLTSYLFWDAANKYHALRQVLTATSTNL
ncbi:hypothetical protein HYS79_00010 [Patescibacteria group bacterium]|nr:hypothetical protein [Patescibacteria group bacterium]